MKIVVVGLGSMGKRRIRLILKQFENIQIVGVDERPDRRDEVIKLFNVRVYDRLDQAIRIEKPEAAFICTGPQFHPQITIECLNFGLHIFSEINLINENHNDLIKIAKKKDLKLFLSSTPMYRKEIQYITNSIAKELRPVNYIYHVGQYLPDWHPWENYKDFFVGNKKTNGCREILAIELPWMLKAFGEAYIISVTHDKNSALNIDYSDNYIINLMHESGTKGVFIVDILSRKATRYFEVYNENLHIQWFGTPDTLSKFNIENNKTEQVKTYNFVEKNECYSENIIENMYIEEIGNFFDCMDGKSQPLYSFEQDVDILKLIDAIEGEQN